MISSIPLTPTFVLELTALPWLTFVAGQLGDPAMMGRAEAGLAHPRVQPEVTDQLLRRTEPVHAADCRHEACGHCQVDADDGQQALDPRPDQCHDPQR